MYSSSMQQTLVTSCKLYLDRSISSSTVLLFALKCPPVVSSKAMATELKPSPTNSYRLKSDRQELMAEVGNRTLKKTSITLKEGRADPAYNSLTYPAEQSPVSRDAGVDPKFVVSYVIITESQQRLPFSTHFILITRITASAMWHRALVCLAQSPRLLSPPRSFPNTTSYTHGMASKKRSSEPIAHWVLFTRPS